MRARSSGHSLELAGTARRQLVDLLQLVLAVRVAPETCINACSHLLCSCSTRATWNTHGSMLTLTVLVQYACHLKHACNHAHTYCVRAVRVPPETRMEACSQELCTCCTRVTWSTHGSMLTHTVHVLYACLLKDDSMLSHTVHVRNLRVHLKAGSKLTRTAHCKAWQHAQRVCMLSITPAYRYIARAYVDTQLCWDGSLLGTKIHLVYAYHLQCSWMPPTLGKVKCLDLPEYYTALFSSPLIWCNLPIPC